MKLEILKWLCCPDCQGEIYLPEESSAKSSDSTNEVKEGLLKCAKCNASFPIKNYIPRFVPEQNYVQSFGYQWNLFKKTQLDSYSKTDISKNRFFRQSAWDGKLMENKLVLDAGCGAGRFAEVALTNDSEVIAIDYSSSVDSCWENLKAHKKLHVLQADIYNLPFKANIFDYVYSFGVLQHTPDVKNAFFSLFKMIKPKGNICVDFYRFDWKVFFWPKYWLRPITRNLSPDFLFNVVKKMIPILLPASCLISRIPKIGYYLKYAIPIANYSDTLPLNNKQLFEWSVLDTFDMLAPKYDYPQNEKTVKKWFQEAGFINFEVFNSGLVVARGEK